MSGHGLRMSDFETIGWVSPGCEVKLIEDNEILCRGDGIFLGYYKNPEATEETRGDGWFHTGDAGYLDEEGRLIYWDRVKELVELKSGAKYPPQYIEGKLKFSPFIRDCMSMGGKDRDFVSAIVAVDFEVGGRWAEAHHVPYTTITDLSQKQEIIDLITKDLRRVNRTLPEEQRVRKFVNLHKEFDPDEAELTRTRKLRRAYMEDRYKGIIDAIYCGKDSYTVEAPITYRDGRQGIIKTEIKVNAVEE
jgi:long-chain acyl-CoA synthetase